LHEQKEGVRISRIRIKINEKPGIILMFLIEREAEDFETINSFIITFLNIEYCG
jgi:hypothetical protein